MALAVSVVLIVIAVKLSPEAAERIAKELIDAWTGHYLSGWLVAAGLLIGWMVHAKLTRRRHANEMERVGKEKSELQNRLLGSGIKSSQQKT